jgi:hypothetical protein
MNSIFCIALMSVGEFKFASALRGSSSNSALGNRRERVLRFEVFHEFAFVHHIFWPSKVDQDRILFRICLSLLLCSVHEDAAFVLSTRQQMNSVKVGLVFYNVMHESESTSLV